MNKMIILCTHHKGGVGKTELAIQISGVLREQLKRTLVVDCDSQASSWYHYFGESPTAENEPEKVKNSEILSVMWNPKRQSIKHDLSYFDYFVLDVDSPLEHTVQTIVQNDPHLVLIPVNLQHGALSSLKDSLSVIEQLGKIKHRPRVRIVPLGARISDIREQLDEIKPKIDDCQITRRMRELLKETNQARKEGRYIWEIPGCEDLKQFYIDLLSK